MDGQPRSAREVGAFLEVVAERLVGRSTSPVDLPVEPMEALVGAVLAYRTTPASAAAAAEALRERFPSWAAIATAPTGDVAAAIRPAGLCHQRALLLQRLVRRVLLDDPAGRLERLCRADDATLLAYLEELPGVGAFGARWVLLTAFARPVFPVAWPARRVLERLGLLARSARVRELTRDLALDRSVYCRLHTALVEHAHHICLPRQPRCRSCSLTDLCPYYQRYLRRAFVPDAAVERRRGPRRRAAGAPVPPGR